MFKNFVIAGALMLTTLPVSAAVDGNAWSIDPAHSSANFSVRHMMISNVRGTLGKLEGTVNYNGTNLTGAGVKATIDANSIDTRDEQRDKHLKSPDFLDTAKFPTITFASKSVVKTPKGFDINGELTLHGVTKPVTLHATPLSEVIKDPYGKHRVGTTATATINRKDFGVTFNKQMDNGGAMVGDELAIELDIEFAH